MTPELLASCWIHAGDVNPASTDQRSPVPIEERVRLVAETGWSGIGLVHADLFEIRDTIGYPALKTMIADAGISTVEVEFLEGWWLTGPERAAADTFRDELFEAATALGARHIKVGAGTVDPGAEILPLDTMAKAYAELGEAASAAGVRLALEATPFSHLPDTRLAIDVVTRADNPDAGLLVDVWHTSKNGIPHDELWKMVPMELVNAVEIDDGTVANHGTWFEESSDLRRYPGEGEFDVPRFVECALDAGWDGPWGVEIISAEHRATPVREALEKTRDTALSCFPA